MNLRPLQDRVLVKRINHETISRGGIIIPETAQEKPLEGEVIAIGDGRWIGSGRLPVSVSPGDKILFARYAGTEIKVDGIDHVILDDDEILGLVGEI